MVWGRVAALLVSRSKRFSFSPNSAIFSGFLWPGLVLKSMTATGQNPPLPSTETQVGGWRQGSPLRRLIQNGGA